MQIVNVTALVISLLGSFSSAQAQSQDSQIRLEHQQDDVQAIVGELWDQHDGAVIEMITVGIKCDVISETMGTMAIKNTESLMKNEAKKVGLEDSLVPSIAKISADYVASGQLLVRQGACSKLTAEQRGRLHQIVAALTPNQGLR